MKTTKTLNMVGEQVPIYKMGLGDVGNLLRLSPGQITGDYTAEVIRETRIFRVLNEVVRECPWVTEEVTSGEASAMAEEATEGTARVRDADWRDLCRGKLKKRFRRLWNDTFQYREHLYEVNLEQLLGVIYAMWCCRPLSRCQT